MSKISEKPQGDNTPTEHSSPCDGLDNPEQTEPTVHFPPSLRQIFDSVRARLRDFAYQPTQIEELRAKTAKSLKNSPHKLIHTLRRLDSGTRKDRYEIADHFLIPGENSVDDYCRLVVRRVFSWRENKKND